MLVCSTFAQVARQLISLAIQPLDLALRLSDRQLGLPRGFVVAHGYAVMELPIARAIDRRNRVRIRAPARAEAVR